jgi:hypothetical protein
VLPEWGFCRCSEVDTKGQIVTLVELMDEKEMKNIPEAIT